MVAGLTKELREHNVAVIGLMPDFVGTERMAIELAAFGFDASRGLPVENPHDWRRGLPARVSPPGRSAPAPAPTARRRSPTP